jgi:DNA-binding response OmpR family regulator
VPKALIVEDDVDIATDLANLLKLNDWTAEICHHGADALQLMLNYSYDLFLLDWTLPEMTGFEICQKYRQKGGNQPIIFISGNRDISFKEAGLDAGSDDYITKPFDERELMARIRSVMRRPREISPVEDLQLGSFQLDIRKRTISNGNTTVQLTNVEYKLLEYLFRHHAESFSTAQLFAAVWESDADSSEETVRVHIRVLRKKLELANFPPVIEHRRGFGYSIAKQV